MSSTHDMNNSFDALTNLLVKTERDRIQRIENRLDDPMLRAKEISQSLAHAISLSVMESNQISRVMEPVIDASLKASVKKNPKAIADVISPALGPGIRKAISSTLMGMIQSLNQVLNHSFSIQGLKWRFQAFKTGKPFAEIVLLNTLVYQVEQIFLIHKESGIVLEHVVSKDVIVQDPDLVSAMLTAIQDFVKDSFSADSQEDLETLRMGSDRSIWIEKGEHALLAAVIRGTPPMDLKYTYRALIEQIHTKSGSSLEHFNGDPLPFSVFREQLKDGLQFQEKKNQQKVSPWLWCILFIVLGFISIWGFNAFVSIQAWNQYLTRLKTQKGLIVISTDKHNGIYTVKGLRDPMAADPQMLLTQQEKNRIIVEGSWLSYYSLDPEFILNRALKILSPPPGVTLSLLSGNTILAQGESSEDWLQTFRTRAITIPGITYFDDSKVQNLDQTQLDLLVDKLATFRIYFQNNSTRLVDGQEEQLSLLVNTIQQIQKIQSALKNYFQITIIGHTDSSGTEKLNLALSRNRAEKIINHLIVQGIHPALLNYSGIGSNIPLIKEHQTADKQYNRAVSFKIFYIDTTKDKG
ncbi:MAG: OmpA family protein [Pseudomonadota bacterium]